MDNKEFIKRSVLLVEDDSDLRNLLEESLEGLDVTICVAANGKEALELLKQHSFDCCLCDIQMPEMSGMELLETCQKLHLITPFVFLTGAMDQTFMLQALRLGAVDFLSKPYRNDELVAVIQRTIEIGIRRNAIANMHRSENSGEAIEAAEKMIGLFRVANNSKRSKTS